MYTFSHALSGIVVLKALNVVLPESIPFNNEFILYAAIFSSLQDIDAWLTQKVNQHHNTLTHTLFLWLLVLMVGNVFHLIWKIPDLTVLILLILFPFIHIAIDFFTCRSTGPMLLFPFSKKHFGLSEFRPEIADFHWTNLAGWKNHIKDLFRHKTKLFIEMSLCLAGLILLIWR